jgi:hypothetical protein
MMKRHDLSAPANQPSPAMVEDLEADRGRRDQEDQHRDRAVYEYLLTLTDLELSGGKRGRGKEKAAKPNESSIAKQWGVERIFVRRVLRSVLHEKYYPDEEKQPVPGLTLGKLVKILSALQMHWNAQRSTTPDRQVPRILTRTEKLRALQKFSQLSVAERGLLELPVHPGEVLFQRMLEEATDPIKGMRFEDAVQLYTTFLRQPSLLSSLQFDSSVGQSNSDRKQAARGLIAKTVAHLINQHFQDLEDKRKQEKIDELVEKVEREISRIEFQAGVKQADFFLGSKMNQAIQEKSAEYLGSQFVQRLTRSVVENEILTDEFPIYFKYFEVEKVRPLPLLVKKEGQETGLLNPALLEDGEDEDRINGLERQFAYKVKVHFYVKLPDHYQTAFSETEIKQELGYKRFDFFEEITGIGSPLSHIVTIINRILFQDIPVLKDYLPIPDEVLNNDESIGNNNHSPIWSYSLVRLYKFDDINRAILENTTCEQVAEYSETAYGEFCGFDLIEVSAMAALLARLRLIKQTGVDPEQYLQEFFYRIEERETFRRARSRLSFYPFSLRAMEGELEQTIFGDRYRIKHKDFKFIEKKPGTFWSATAYEAHLEIAEANLKEGLYRVAKKYLDIIKPYFEQETVGFLSSIIYVKYHFCWFRYDYLSDLDDPDCPYPDRYQAVRAAEIRLEEAQKCLDSRLAKYCQLNELPQSNFHPHFHLLARVYAHRAKLYIFFPAYTRQVSTWHSLLEPVRLLEKARICSARDGDPTLYAQWSAYQSWCYLMLAYLGDQSQFPTKEFSKEKCIDWAKRLISHTLRCYASTGKTCYQQIKDNGGKATNNVTNARNQSAEIELERAKRQGQPQTKPLLGKKYYETYGKTKVQVVPLIQELSGESSEDDEFYDLQNNMLSLDMSILKEIRQNEGDCVYLFGSTSSIILFAMGMLELCQELHDREQLLKSIQQKALRMFTYCWAIASDGTQRNNPSGEEDTIILDRVFEAQDTVNQSGDLLLRGLYPHRFTQFADLGKIFVAVCKLLLIIAHPSIKQFYAGQMQWETVAATVHVDLKEIFQLIADLRSNNRFPTPEILGQQRYNGHLAEHFKNVEQYFQALVEQLQARQLKSLHLIHNRNKIVADIFQIIRGNSNIHP